MRSLEKLFPTPGDSEVLAGGGRENADPAGGHLYSHPGRDAHGSRPSLHLCTSHLMGLSSSDPALCVEKTTIQRSIFCMLSIYI